MLQQFWQMLLPGWQMEWPPQGVFMYTGRCYYQVADGLHQQFGRCCCWVADGIVTTRYFYVYWWMLLPGVRWNSHRVSYSNLSSGVLSRTSSHMCGRWYLTVFLLRDGLLTLMYNASFIHLLRFWSSLPNIWGGKPTW